VNKPLEVILKLLLMLLFGVFALPCLGFGLYLGWCSLRIHFSHVYYADYSYISAAFIFLTLSLLSLWAGWFGAWRRSFRGTLFLIPLLVGLVTAEIIPNVLPHGFSGVADTNYLSDVHSFFRVWYEGHHKFPATESEFATAMAQGPAAWPDGLPPAPASEYKQRGVSLPYQISVETNATGPHLQNVSQRPGVIYYCVSADLQEFWVTMTSLPADVSRTAVLRHVADVPGEPVELVHAAGRDYPIKKP
jgi:hypothetical protein